MAEREQPRPVGGGEQEFTFRNVQILKQEIIGTGPIGAVCKAKCDQLICAAKLLYPFLFDIPIDLGKEHRQPLRRFEHECLLLKSLYHPNIVRYLGTYHYPEINGPVLLMELMDESLTHFLESSPGDIPYHIQVNLSQDIAQALAFLHANGIIHRDLSSNNVLLNAGSQAKISDFGMARLTDLNATRFVTMTLCPGTVLVVYMPPEAFDEPPLYTEKLDNFSFGIILIQIMTRKFPKPSNRYKVEIIPDRHYPARTVEAKVAVSEVNRRQAHINLIESTHPLLPIALECLKDKDVERPPSWQLCQSLDALKVTAGYEASQADVVQLLQEQVREKDKEIQHKNQQILDKQQDLQVLQQKKNEEIQEKDLQIQNKDQHYQLQKIMQVRENNKLVLMNKALQHDIEAKEQQLQRLNQELKSNEKIIITLQQANRKGDREIAELKARLQEENAGREQLEQQIAGLQKLLSAQNLTSESIEFWQVPRNEVTLHIDQELGHGGWGVVVKGKFRGKDVAVKCIHQENLIYQRAMLLERFKREIQMMAKLRHPNLVLFIAAVLDDHNSPPLMIITEILETTLRKIVERNLVGQNKLSIFKDISSALQYLHHHREAIIHIDVSTANVLVSASANGKWTAKLSDFGSANLARVAKTLGDGALVYTAPEAYPQPAHPNLTPTQRTPQTTKIDVYSFGVLACEVITRNFPDPIQLTETIRLTHHLWPEIQPMICSCLEYQPESRPTMAEVLSALNEIDKEP